MSRKIKTILGKGETNKFSALDKKIGLSDDYDLISQIVHGDRLIKEFKTYNPELVIVSEAIRDNEKHKNAYELAADMNALNPNSVIVMLVTEKTAENVEKCMISGVRLLLTEEELENDNVLTKIKRLIEKLYENKEKVVSREGKVITLMSSKGGVGKTTASLNIAAGIAERDKNAKVLLMDFDLQFGDALVLTKISPERTIMNLVNKAKIDSDSFKQSLLPHPLGFQILGAPERADDFARINKERLIEIVKIAKNLFDYVIIDSMQGFQQPTMAAIQNSDYIYIVTRSHLMELNNAFKAIKTLEQYLNKDENNVTGDKCRLLLNQYEETGVPIKSIKERIKYPIIGILPRNTKIANQSNDYNDIIINKYENTDLGEAYSEFIDNIINEVKGEDLEEVKEKDDKVEKKSFLSKLIGK